MEEVEESGEGLGRAAVLRIVGKGEEGEGMAQDWGWRAGWCGCPWLVAVMVAVLVLLVSGVLVLVPTRVCYVCYVCCGGEM